MANPNGTDVDRNRKGRFTESIATAERDAEIAKLLAQHVPIPEIAAKYHITERTVRNARARVIEQIRVKAGRDYLEETILELDEIGRRQWEIANEPGLRIGNTGKPIENPVTGEYEKDLDLSSNALDKARKVIADKRVLLGLDQPKKRDTTYRLELIERIKATAAELTGVPTGQPLPQIESPEEPIDAEIIDDEDPGSV